MRRIAQILAVVSLPAPLLAQSPQPSSHAAPHPIAPLGTQMLMQSSGGSLLQASLPEQPDSLNTKTPAYSLYAVPVPEPKVLKKHDLVNIVVREESQSSSKGTTDFKKTGDFDAKLESFIKFDPSNWEIAGEPLKSPPEIKFSGSRNLKGDASADRTDSVVARIEAEVLDVKPNATLVLQARKHIKSEEEEQTFILTGVCRVQDIDASNSVLSTDLHDLDLQKITNGAVRDRTKRGLLPRLLDFVNPF
jgi:flagellar L-ring protein precursor FlgH